MRTALLLLCLLASSPSLAQKRPKALDQQLLECGYVEAATSALKGEQLDLEGLSLEGGSAEVTRSAPNLVRITGTLLGESYRFNFDYRFVAGELVCATEVATSLHTVLRGEHTWDDPASGEVPNARWRRDFIVFAKGKVLLQQTAAAPKDAGPQQTAEELKKFAADLLERATPKK